MDEPLEAVAAGRDEEQVGLVVGVVDEGLAQLAEPERVVDMVEVGHHHPAGAEEALGVAVAEGAEGRAVAERQGLEPALALGVGLGTQRRGGRAGHGAADVLPQVGHRGGARGFTTEHGAPRAAVHAARGEHRHHRQRRAVGRHGARCRRLRLLTRSSGGFWEGLKWFFHNIFNLLKL